jgi:HPt (histidine-containing phosphotransfer) domain-containing protein
MKPPVIDWELATKLAGNSQKFAKTMLDILVKNLPDDFLKIKKSYTQDYSEFRNQLHRLHGALCYCGAPRLKAAVIELEFAAEQKDKIKIPALIDNLEKEVTALINGVRCTCVSS